MSVAISFEWHPYRYFPYERRLARREVKALLGITPRGGTKGLSAVVPNHPEESLLRKLTYFREVRVNGSPPVFPMQAQLEATAGTKASPALFVDVELPQLRRQSTRYSAHGLHEYRGKFHPHIVRAIGNLLQVPSDAWIADPFCGSGTTLLEAAHAGWNAVGVDMNPLGVFISKTKLGALRVAPSVLQSRVEQLVRSLESLAATLDYEVEFSAAEVRRLGKPLETHTIPNREYLDGWFPRSVLEQLACVDRMIGRVEPSEVRDIAKVVLSDCLRAVSLQDPGDLRIRRRKDPKANYPAIPSFVSALRSRVATILRARALVNSTDAVQDAVLGDSRQGLPAAAPRPPGTRGFDGIITSPPYATALPYIDTQRLSLAFLGLVDQSGIRELEADLIGTREISTSTRREEESALNAGANGLPDSVLRLCRRALRLSAAAEDGFRRKNVPALLFRYFTDMRAVFAGAATFVRPGGFFAALVGPNRTTLGGEAIEIDTPSLLIEVAESAGWRRGEVVPLDTYQRFDLHRSNSITSEALIVLRRGAAA